MDDRGKEILRVWIPGNPATFATAGEKPWKEELLRTIPECASSSGEAGVILVFRLATLSPHGQPLDLDNLCEPVFSVLVNRLGWFGKHRPNIQWWAARKGVGSETGCKLRILREARPRIGAAFPPLFDSIYQGPLPTSAQDPMLSEWVQNEMDPRKGGDSRQFAARLRFGTTHINLGEISAGPVKSIIDSLYPIVGGKAGSPEDWRIQALGVEKGIPNLPEDGVQVTIWELG